jgi:drug/metabolite transporter (DMT)-like permease
MVTICTIGSQMVLKRGVNGIISVLKTEGSLAFILSAATSPIVIAAVALQGVAYVIWLFVVAQERLSVAFAISGSFFYLTMAFASWFFYGERLTAYQWFGLVFITVGVLLVTLNQGAAR